jgi:hypothetical protein
MEAVGKRPSAALPSSLVTAAYFYVRFIPRDFVPQQSLRDGHFPSASEVDSFRQSHDQQTIWQSTDFTDGEVSARHAVMLLRDLIK